MVRDISDKMAFRSPTPFLPPRNGAGQGWQGNLTVSVDGQPVNSPTVNVVNFVITTPASAFKPGAPTDVGGIRNFPGGAQRKLVTSADPPQSLVGLAWWAQVAINAPTPASARQIEVGFVQNVTAFTNDGDKYIPADTASSTLDRSGGRLLDQKDGKNAGAWAWYAIANNPAYQSTYTPSQQTSSVVLNQDDTPFDGPPAVWHLSHKLAHMKLNYAFELDICATTKDSQNKANTVYVEQSTATWQFDGSGSVGQDDNATYTKDRTSKVTPPTSWSAQITSGATPTTAKPNFDTLISGDPQHQIPGERFH